MRPSSFVLCIAAWLLVAAVPCAHAQSGGVYNSAALGQSPSAIPADNAIGLPGTAPLISTGRSPAGHSIPQSVAQGGSLRDEPTRNDQSWTRSANAGNALPSNSSSLNISPSSALPTPSVFPASGIQPVRGQSEASSFVAQAQFTSTEPSAPNAQKTTTGAAAAAEKEPRAIKPPTVLDSSAQNKRSGGTAQMVISVVSSLLIVVGLLLGAAWCYRKASPNASGSLPKQVLQVLGRTPLAPRQQLVLVRFGPKLILVSNLQGEVRTISEIDDPLEVDRVAGLCESSQAGSISDSFRTVLHNIGRTG